MDFYPDKFKEVKNNKGLTTKELCRILQVTRTSIWNWENNKNTPSAEYIRLLAKTLNVGVEEISNLEPEVQKLAIDYSNAVDSCNSLLNREKLATHNDQLRKAINTISSIRQELDQTSLILNAIFNETSSIFYIKDTNCKYVAANRNFLKNLSLLPTYNIYGRTDYDLLSKYEAKKNNEMDKEILHKGTHYKSEDYIPGSRKRKWGYIEKYPIYNEEGKITGLISTCKDITEQRIFEAENRKHIHEKNILYEAVNSIEKTITLIFKRTKANKPEYQFISDNIKQILGYEKSYLINENIYISSLVHKNQREKAVEYFIKPEDAFLEKKVQIRKNNGTYIWMITKIKKKIEQNGDITFIGFLIS